MPHDHPGVSSPSSTPELGSRPRPDIPRSADAARGSTGRLGADSRLARTRARLAFPPPVLPGQPATLAKLTPEDRQRGLADFRRVLAANRSGAPEQIQCFAVPGHKADFGIVMAGPDLRAIHDVQMAVQASGLGPALEPTYSFYSITEVSEYVPDADEYARSFANARALIPTAACSRPR